MGSNHMLHDSDETIQGAAGTTPAVSAKLVKGRAGLSAARKLANILSAALNTTQARVMLKKILKRLEKRGSLSREQNHAWLQSNHQDFATLAVAIDPDLWSESQQFGQELRSRATAVLSRLDVNLSGGGYYPMLYFVTRWAKPDCIVETGVAAGYSSQAFLMAIRRNGTGRLHSSDFPLFRLPDPRRFIGILVEETLREGWDLHVNGDEANLPVILSRIQQVDVFHYDSDKSYSGRAHAMSLITERMSHQGLIIMDDVQDNSFFFDYITNNNISEFSIFDFENKYIGLIGSLVRPQSSTLERRSVRGEVSGGSPYGDPDWSSDSPNSDSMITPSSKPHE